MADLTGEIIDSRYQLTRIIDSGGMATIYAALDLRLDRQVAVKIMHPHLAQDENYVSRFIREAKAAAAISHPNIVAIQDQGWNQGGTPAVFIVMELIEGATLREYLNERGRLPLADFLPIIKPVLSALAAAHRVGIVHRDVKPENVLISKDGRVKIADFGLARGAIIGQTMTAESSVVLGSVSYLAPEQVQRGIADARSDVYSTAIMIFEALSGEKPFAGDDPIQVALKHVKERVPRLSQMMTGISPALDDLIYLATSSNPDDRPTDAAEFLERLKEAEGSSSSSQRQMSLELDLGAVTIPQPSREEEKSKAPLKTSAKDFSNQREVEKSEKSSKLPERSSIEEKNVSSSGRKKSGKRKLSKRVKRNRTIAVAILLALIAGIWYIAIGPGNRIVVPSVAGMSLTQASNTLTPLGINVEVKEREFSEDIAEGKVLRSDPAGGDKVSEGGTVFLYISGGKERYTVPTIAGLTPEEATKLIEDSNLRVGAVTERFSPDVEKGRVIAQDPAASARVKKDSLVNFVISKGIEEMSVKSYVNQSGDQALNELTEAGFEAEIQYQYSDTVPPGAVIAQIPGGDQPLPKGSKVLIIVSEGREYVFVPDVNQATVEEATNILVDAGLKVKVQLNGKAKVKRVYNISPIEGTTLKRGSTVTITAR